MRHGQGTPALGRHHEAVAKLPLYHSDPMVSPSWRRRLIYFAAQRFGIEIVVLQNQEEEGNSDAAGAVANVVEFRGWRSLRALTQP